MVKTLLCLCLAAGAAAAAPVRVIFDTDIGNDIDDALALAILHALESRGEAKILAVTITKDNRWSAPYVDLVDTFYGRPGIPIGVVRHGKTPEDGRLTRLPVEQSQRPPRFDWPDATTVLRDILARERDHAVTIVQVGFSTNLARLLEAPADRDLVRRKVRLLSVMAGAFPAGKPEFNVKTDIPAARKLFAEWPTDIVASGYEVGLSILYPASSIEHDFRYAPDHPIAAAYRAFKPMPYDRPTWDPTAALHAVRPGRTYFDLSKPGKISVDAEGITHFEEQTQGKHRYLIVNDEQRARVLKAMIDLASQPPDRKPIHR